MSEKALTLKQSGVRWLWLAILVFIADIGIKLVVMDNMGYGWANRIEVLPFFSLLYVHNYGAAFSFLSDQAGWQRWLFTGIAFVDGSFDLLDEQASSKRKMEQHCLCTDYWWCSGQRV